MTAHAFWRSMCRKGIRRLWTGSGNLCPVGLCADRGLISHPAAQGIPRFDRLF